MRDLSLAAWLANNSSETAFESVSVESNNK